MNRTKSQALAQICAALVVANVGIGGVAAANPADDLFAGCDVLGAEPGVDRRIKCRTFSATASPEKPSFGAEALLEGMVGALKSSTEGTVKHEVFQLSLAGATRRAIRYTVRKAGPSVIVEKGIFTTVPSAVDKIRVVGCEEKTEGKCGEVLEALARGLPDANRKPTAAVEARGNAIAGRELEVPSGCTMKAPARISCPSGELTWMHSQAGDPDTLDAVTGPLRTAFSNLGTVQQEDRTCTIEGSEAPCRQLTIAKPSGQKLFTVVGFGTARGQRIYIQCNTSHDLTKGIPLPCGQVLSMK